jgi:RNA-binding protein YhbY
MNFSFAKFQIGKNGINSGVIDSLSLVFKTHKQVRISVLKSSSRDKEYVKNMANEIVVMLEDKKEYSYSFKVIGFTIIMTRQPFVKKFQSKTHK